MAVAPQLKPCWDPTPAPAITSISPTTVSAAAGPQVLTITGTGFYPDSIVKINGNQVGPSTVNSPTQITLSGWDPSVVAFYTFQVENSEGADPGYSYQVVA